MSATLLIAPHADDETLFASYLAQRYAAHIVVVYDEGRETELSQATQWLGCTYTQLQAHKAMHPSAVLDEILEYALKGYTGTPERVIAPAIVEHGHEEHNLVGELVQEVFRSVPITWYLTYAPRGQRDRHGVPVHPYGGADIARKLAAMSCYRSQILDVATRPWFYDLLDMREWVA